MIRTKHHIVTTLLLSLAGALFPTQAPADGKSSLWAPWPKDSYYKDHPLFHWYPSEDSTKPQSVYRFGPVGIGIDLTLPAFGMKVKNVEEGSPAAATGKLQQGQVIESINGKTLKDIDPRVLLGNLITQAEATDGKVVLKIKDVGDVPVNIPVLGAYSKTWPLNCPKSDKIVRGVADYLAKNGNPLGALGHDQGLLFLLSTGEEKDLEVARTWVAKAVEATKDKATLNAIPWSIGYGAPAYCEYYLRTGDESALPLIKKNADQASRVMYNGGWNHRTAVNFKYGHMNAAGIHCVKFLLLAKECGVDVDEYTLQTSLRHFFRFAGRGNVAYGDGMPEGGFVDNGKVGGLAFTMAAAASLAEDGEKSVYAKARDVSAVKGFYSTSWMHHGHTGGGIGEVWRSSAMSLMYDRKPTKFREFMDNRAWHLDLSRRFDGSMTVLRDTDYSKGYDNEMWGAGYAMTYTIPRKTLRMTGAPPSKYCKTCQLPVRPWGTAADDIFYSLEPAPGHKIDVDAEKLATDASWPILRKLNQPNVADEVLLNYAGHPDYNVRQATAMVIRESGRDKLIFMLLDDKDPRVRQAGLMVLCIDTFGMTTIPAERVTHEMADRMSRMISDPNESWWVVENAMMGLSLAKPEQIAPNVDVLLKWLKHDDWWMQRAAMTALAPLATDPKFAARIVPAIAEMASKNTHSGAVSGLPKLIEALSKASPQVQKIASEAFAKAYETFPTTLRAPGGMDMQNAVPHLQGGLASAVASFPGGFDTLYKISRKIMPGEALPYKELYFKSDAKKFGPELADIMPKIVTEDVIPEYIADHMDAVVEETRWATVQEKPKRDQFAIGALDGMVSLYNEIGINDYNWHTFGPARDAIRWDYFSYDAAQLIKNQPGNPKVYMDMLSQAGGKLAKAEAEAKKLAAAVSNADKQQKSSEDLKAKAAAAGKALETARQQTSQAMLAGTLPAGMEEWFSLSFSPEKAGWKKGLAPFANAGGKLATAGRCKGNFCGCGEKPNTLWEKDVLIMRATLSVPPLKPDCRYRLLLGGNIHSKQGAAVTVYINGKPVHQQGGFGGRLRGQPRGFFIDKALASEFQKGKVVIGVAALKSPNAYLTAWLEEMKMPAVSEADMLNALTRAPMMCSEWQELQDPDATDKAADPNEGKYRYSGRFADNQRIHGEWKVVDRIDDLESFTGPRANNPFAATDDTISFLPNGKTSNPKWIWTSGTLMALDKKEALAISVKSLNGREYLFLECGGFSPKNPKGWQTPIFVMEKVGR